MPFVYVHAHVIVSLEVKNLFVGFRERDDGVKVERKRGKC